jgi:hypothetical protein
LVAGPLVAVTLFGLGFLATLGSAMTATAGSQEPPAGVVAGLGLWLIAFLVGILGAVYSAVVMLVLYYRMWSAIQDGQARTNPAQAVGFLFIPFFNFYWMFQVLWGFSVDYNKFIARHGLNVPQLPEGFFLTVNILFFGMIIPFLNLLVVMPTLFVLQIVVAAKVCDAVNALAAAQSARAVTAPA